MSEHNTRNKVFYLKINRNEGYTIRNLRHWMETVKTYNNVDCFIICDNDDLHQKVVENLSTDFPDIEDRIIKSIINDETQYIIGRVTDERWHKAGYAHISTFVHARDNDYHFFWNIDADDTRFCLSPDRCHALLDEAEKYALSNNIDCFSLDMHTTLIASGRHWSFGVTFTRNDRDWMAVMREACQNDISIEDQWPNIDRFFRYIRNHVDGISIESFYAENLKFLHYSNDFFWRLNVSALFHWKAGFLTLPILYYGVGLQNEKSHMKIDPIVRELNINITDEETVLSMINACNTPSFYLR